LTSSRNITVRDDGLLFSVAASEIASPAANACECVVSLHSELLAVIVQVIPVLLGPVGPAGSRRTVNV
jgi:hypothetical protein